MDHKRFNAMSSAEQAAAIVAAGAKARGQPPLCRPEDDSRSLSLAAAIIRAGAKARGQLNV
jgi:hypothetical protein